MAGRHLADAERRGAGIAHLTLPHGEEIERRGVRGR
jgi:hypothetical protein